jgi:hypothetical protein
VRVVVRARLGTRAVDDCAAGARDGDDMSGVFDINAIAGRFPPTADTMLIDTRLTDEQEASCRVFRIYVDVPAHYHKTCDEYLFVVSGRGMFKIGEMDWFEANAGQLIFSRRALSTPSRCSIRNRLCFWRWTRRGEIQRTFTSSIRPMARRKASSRRGKSIEAGGVNRASGAGGW